MRRLRSYLPLIAIALVALTAISALLDPGPKTVTRTVTAQPPVVSKLGAREATQLCPSGRSYAGCASLPAPTSPRQSAPLTLNAPVFPDVSLWQGRVDWPRVAAWQRSHGWPTGGIFKMGEYRIDPQAANNAAGTRGLGWRAGYWFVRNTGCRAEADQIISAARAYGLRLVEEDLEVPEARGYGLCLTPLLRRAGLLVGTYTAPGTNPGGVDTSTSLWEATFGSGFTAIWHPVVAWQCSDGVHGCVTNIPGIGRDDVNIDYGISRLVTPPPPPDPFAIFPKRRYLLAGGVRASEHNTIKTYRRRGCQRPVRRPVCKSSYYHARLLRDRQWFVAHHTRDLKHTVRRARWGQFDLGRRFQAFSRIVG